MTVAAPRGRLIPLMVLGRLVVGGGALVMPRVTGRAFGIDPDENPAAAYVGRLFGARAVAMAWLVATSAGEEQQRQLRVALAVDVVDAAAALAAGRRRELAPRAATMAFAAALTEVALGVAALTPPVRRPGGRAG